MPHGVLFYWYEPSFYTGFAPRTQDPSRPHIQLSRGNQLRVTLVLGPDELDNYADDLLLRYNTYQQLLDKGIIRNRKKIESSINNAKRFLEVREQYGSFCNYFWRFTDGKQVVNHFTDMSEIPATTPLSDTIAKDMKGRGFQFLGSTTIYAHLQAPGLVNDHLVDCFRHQECMEQ